MTAAAQQGAGTGTPRQFARFYALSLCVTALALLASFLAGPELKTPILYAALSAGVAGLIAFPIVHLGLAHGTNGLFAAITAGMFVRMGLVAAGLVASGLRGSLAIVFTFVFLLVFAGTVGVEIAYVIACSRTRGPVSPS